jgi:hypothetical protein
MNLQHSHPSLYSDAGIKSGCNIRTVEKGDWIKKDTRLLQIKFLKQIDKMYDEI